MSSDPVSFDFIYLGRYTFPEPWQFLSKVTLIYQPLTQAMQPQTELTKKGPRPQDEYDEEHNKLKTHFTNCWVLKDTGGSPSKNAISQKRSCLSQCLSKTDCLHQLLYLYKIIFGRKICMSHLAFKATYNLKGNGCYDPMDVRDPANVLYPRHLWYLEGDALGCRCLYRIHDPVETPSKEKTNFTVTYISILYLYSKNVICV